MLECIHCIGGDKTGRDKEGKRDWVLTQAVVRDEKKKKKNRNGRRMEKEVIVELG